VDTDWYPLADNTYNLGTSSRRWRDAYIGRNLTVGGIAFGLWQKIRAVEVTADCDYVDFTGLDINADGGFYIILATIKNPTTNVVNYRIYINGDYTDSNYYYQDFVAGGTDVAAMRANCPNITIIDGGGERCFTVIYVTRDPDGYFRAMSITNTLTGSAIELFMRTVCKTATVTNITSIRIASSVAGGIGVGSRFVLYRCRPS